jgi:hypothetical protein
MADMLSQRLKVQPSSKSSVACAVSRSLFACLADIEMLRPKSPVPRNTQQNASRLGPSGGSFPSQGSMVFPVNRPPTFGSMVGGNNNASQMQAAMSMPMHMQMQMSGANQVFSQGHFPNQSPFTPHFQQQQFPQQPQHHTMAQIQHSQPLNAFAAPFVPAGVEPNISAAAMMGFGNPSMMGGTGVGGMGIGMGAGMNPGMGMGVMQHHTNQIPVQMQLQMMQQHEGMQSPFLVDPSMMQQQMQMGLAGMPPVPAMQGMGMGIGMGLGMGMGVSAGGVGRGGGMEIPGMQMSSIPMNNFATLHQQPQFQQPFNANGDGGGALRLSASGPNPPLSHSGGSGGTGIGASTARNILNATPMRQLQAPPARHPNAGGGGGRG